MQLSYTDPGAYAGGGGGGFAPPLLQFFFLNKKKKKKSANGWTKKSWPFSVSESPLARHVARIWCFFFFLGGGGGRNM